MFEWIELGMQHWLRKISGQNKYRYAGVDADAKAIARSDAAATKADAKAEAEAREWGEPVPAKTPKPIRLNLPGAANELNVYSSPSGRCVVHNPVKKRLVVTAIVDAKNFLMQDVSGQEDILDSWESVINLVGAHREVQALFPSDVTTVVSGEQMIDYYRAAAEANGAGEALNPVAHQGYIDLLRNNVQKKHEQYLTVNLSLPEMVREIKDNGGGVVGMLRTADAKMDAIEGDIVASGYSSHWVSVPERRRMTSDFMTPSNNLTHNTDTLIVGANRYWTEMQINDVWHRSYFVDQWPMKPVKPGFMEKVVLGLDFRHSITQVIKRGEDEQALHRINNEIKNYETAQGIAQSMGRRLSRESEREMQDLERREQELVEGSSDVAYSAYISISARSREELEAHERDLFSAAARAQLKLIKCYGAQFEGFLAATAQLGYGADRF
ncbi:SCO6880 family protein [Rothia sp. P4278]|uniref:SCO6880 family protein n=1 Tax=Rothia sp. P4278 TaxID=3402658 RepID=UPI003AED5BC2